MNVSSRDVEGDRDLPVEGSTYRPIGEVAALLRLQPHVLRFWETKFKQITPLKRSGGRRYYRREDVRLLFQIRDLLYVEGYTLRGAQRVLRERGSEEVGVAARTTAASTDTDTLTLSVAARADLVRIKERLEEALVSCGEIEVDEVEIEEERE